MAEITPLAIRQEVIRLKELGKKRSEISRELNLCYSIVWDMCNRHTLEGEIGLQSKYGNCGKQAPQRSDVIYRSALWLKRLHSEWGADYIHCRLSERFLSSFTFKNSCWELPLMSSNHIEFSLQVTQRIALAWFSPTSRCSLHTLNFCIIGWSSWTIPNDIYAHGY